MSQRDTMAGALVCPIMKYTMAGALVCPLMKLADRPPVDIIHVCVTSAVR